MSQNPHFDPRNLHSKSDADKTQQPRPPKPETEARLLAHGHGEAKAALPSGLPPTTKSMSVLSVNAPEFRPKVYSSYHGGSSSVAQMPPPTFPPPPGPAMEDHFINDFGQMNLRAGGGAEMEVLLGEFTQTMLILTTHPANVRDFLKPLCDKLRQAQSPEVLSEVINILYDQSIYEPNFRYTGARVVHFLCQELKDHSLFGNFKMNFLSKCQQDYIRREDLVKSGDEGLATLCGLTMFMGELFLNVTADASGRTERLDFLPSVLTDLLLTLLSQPSDTCIKTVCQLLKLAGGPTEDSIAQKPPLEMQKFNNVFSSLQALQSNPHISGNMKMLMMSVVSLRQNNWGRADSQTSGSGENYHKNPVPQGEFAQSEPVFYDQNGKQITREEAGFHEEADEEEYDGYELTEEEEQDFLLWQKETSVRNDLGMAAPGHMENPNAPPPVYQQWSTAESDYGSSNYYADYPQNYDYNAYTPYIEDEGLNDEMEKAYEEFLSSQRGPPMGK